MPPESIAIIGAGPAGSALAILLAKQGVPVTLFDPGIRPELIVGESLIPSVIPLLRELGIEDEVRSYAMIKPGASFYLRPEDETTILFADVGRRSIPYSYNVPRDRFDATLLQAAERAGAKLVRERVRVAVDEATKKISLFSAGQKIAASFIVDASGRARIISKATNLATRKGTRSDTALFAHFDTVELQHPGNIHINRLKAGWSWRIPLPGKVSVGMVLPPTELKQHGSSSEEQFEQLIESNEILAPLLKGSSRISSVAKYQNYQLISEQFYASNWALVGDAAGFVDPIFSSGLHLSLSGAKLLSRAILQGGSNKQLELYQRRLFGQIRAWQHLAESFYNGKLFGLTRASKFARERFPWSLIVPHFENQLRRVLSGMAATHSYSFRSARFMLDMKVAERYGQRLRVR